MSLKRLFLSLTVIPLFTLASTHAQAEIEQVVLKNPNFTEELKISIDTSSETFSLEKCRLDLLSNIYKCQKVGEKLSVSQLEKVQDELHLRGNAIVGGATLSAITFLIVSGVCVSKGKCQALERFMFPARRQIEGVIFVVPGAALAGGSLAAYLTQTNASQVTPILHLNSAIAQALERDDQETGDLVIETEASLKEIVESC